MQPRWVRWTVIVIVALLAFALALSVVPADAAQGCPVRLGDVRAGC